MEKNKKYLKRSFLLFYFAIVVSFIGNGVNVYAAGQGSTVTKGAFVSKGSYVYGKADNYSIYRMKKNGTDSKRIFDSAWVRSNEIYLRGDYLYFLAGGEGTAEWWGYLYKMSIKNFSYKIINHRKADSMAIIGNRIYLGVYESGDLTGYSDKIVSVDLNGKNMKSFTKGKVNIVAATNSKFIYLNYINNKRDIYITDTKKKERLKKVSGYIEQMVGNNIYYMKDKLAAHDYQLTCWNDKEQKNSIVKAGFYRTESYKSGYVDGSYLYYATDKGIYKQKLGASKTQCIKKIKNVTEITHVGGGYLYGRCYVPGSMKNTRSFVIKTNGKGFRVLKNYFVS